MTHAKIENVINRKKMIRMKEQFDLNKIQNLTEQYVCNMLLNGLGW